MIIVNHYVRVINIMPFKRWVDQCHVGLIPLQTHNYWVNSSCWCVRCYDHTLYMSACRQAWCTPPTDLLFTQIRERSNCRVAVTARLLKSCQHTIKMPALDYHAVNKLVWASPSVDPGVSSMDWGLPSPNNICHTLDWLTVWKYWWLTESSIMDSDKVSQKSKPWFNISGKDERFLNVSEMAWSIILTKVRCCPLF